MSADATGDVLAALGVDALEATPDGFRRLGTPPAWADGAFPTMPADGSADSSADSSAPHTVPTSQGGQVSERREASPRGPLVDLGASDFLAAFLPDAEAAWDAGARVQSGVWTEAGADGAERTLEATALCLGTRRVLLLAPPTAALDTVHGILQTARESALVADAERRRADERETLLHCIVHDLANPLAGIRGSLQLLGETADADAAELVAIGLRSAERMQATIRSILTAFAADVDPLLPQPEAPTADLAEAARRALDAAGPRARAAGVALSAHVPEALPVVATADRLVRAIDNLLENAVRHATSAVELRVDAGADGATLSVLDDGPGIDPAIRDRLFQPFVQGAGGGAAGLGLHSVRLAAGAWGGSAGTTPRDGGAHVWLRLQAA